MITTPEISIVVPVFNEAGNIGPLYERLKTVLDGLGLRYELVFADDGSRDASFEQIRALSQSDPVVKGLSLSRNFGHQVALLAGIRHASGKVVITMDGDLQHPPELIPKLYHEYLAGFDIVNTIRQDPPETGRFKKLSSRWFYSLMNRLSEVRIEPASADFRLMGRKAVTAFLEIPERDRFTRGLVSWMGFRQQVLPYQAEPRFSGKTKYTLFRMLRFAWDGITSFSSRPLRLSFYAGTVVSLLAMLYGLYAVISYLSGKTLEGWTSILVSVLFIGGLQLLSLGIVGEYISRIFNEAKGRPLYFIKDQTDTLTSAQTVHPE
jgi:dolichol-phosphate mannosyltransferase